jgi:CheY-like chemotaxis protein
VNDYPDPITATKTVLESRSDYKLSTDSDGVFALSIKKLRDLIILDVLMPFESGFTAARKLRADPELGEIPVFL